jgi:hypothetical protein
VIASFFGVENPGGYLSRYLLMGMYTVGGVPFQILNPLDDAAAALRY